VCVRERESVCVCERESERESVCERERGCALVPRAATRAPSDPPRPSPTPASEKLTLKLAEVPLKLTELSLLL